MTSTLKRRFFPTSKPHFESVSNLGFQIEMLKSEVVTRRSILRKISASLRERKIFSENTAFLKTKTMVAIPPKNRTESQT
jgi:hypothetical protein